MPVPTSRTIQPTNVRNFGNDGGDFIVFHADTDMELDTVRFGKKTVQWLQSPVFWVSGKGTVEGWKQESTWLVKTP